LDRLTLSNQELLNDVRKGLDEICVKKLRGSKGKFKSLFRGILGDRFHLKRGTILVLPIEEKNVSFDALLEFERAEAHERGREEAIGVVLRRDHLAEVVLEHVEKAWRFWLSRRSHKGGISWEKFEKIRASFPLPRPRIVHNI